MGLVSNLLSLAGLGVFAVLAFFIYRVGVGIANASKERMSAKGVTLKRTGADVRIRSVDQGKYFDQTQKAFVDAWTSSETKGYKSWLWGSEKRRQAAALEEKKRGYRMVDGKKIGVSGEAAANEGWG